MALKIEADGVSLVPNPVDTEGSLTLTFDACEYVPGEYEIRVRRLTSRSGYPYLSRSGKYLLLPVKVPIE